MIENDESKKNLFAELPNTTIKPGLAVACVVTRTDPATRAKAMLVGYRGSACRHGSETWSTPGGRVEYGEPVLRAAERELKEETGLVAVPEESTVSALVESFDKDQHWITVYVRLRLRTKQDPLVLEPNLCETWSYMTRLNLSLVRLFPPFREYLSRSRCLLMGDCDDV